MLSLIPKYFVPDWFLTRLCPEGSFETCLFGDASNPSTSSFSSKISGSETSGSDTSER